MSEIRKEANIFDYLKSIFQGAKKITTKDLIKAAKATLQQTKYSFSDAEAEVLLPFVAKEVKMERDGKDGYKRSVSQRSMAKVRKDLVQSLGQGMHADQVEQRESEYDKEKAEKGKTVGWLNLFYEENPQLKSDAETYYGIIKKLGEVEEKTEADGTLSYKIKIKGAEKFSTNIDGEQYAKLLALSLYKAFYEQEEVALTAKVAGKDVDIKEPAIYLATILTLRSIIENTPEKNEEFKKIVKKMALPLRDSIAEEAGAVPNKEVRAKAIELCQNRIKMLNANGGEYKDDFEKYFHDLMLEQQLNHHVEKVNDLSIRMKGEGSNYPLMQIQSAGNAYYALAGVGSCENDDEAKTKLKNGIMGGAIDAFNYYNTKIMSEKKDKAIDTPEEIAEILLANLLILQESEMKLGDKKAFGQMFIVPLVQCSYNLTPDQIKKAQDAAFKDVRALGFLKDDAYNNYGKTKFSATKEADKFAKEVVKQLRKQPLWREGQLKKPNPGRKALALAEAYILQSKVMKGFGQNVAEVVGTLQDIKTKEEKKAFKALYEPISAVAAKLKEKDEQMLTPSEKSALLSESQATKDNAKDIAKAAAQKKDTTSAGGPTLGE